MQMFRCCLTQVALLALSACALHPKENLRLDEARRAHERLTAEVGRLAPIETARAVEALERATLTWQSREDPALVDHLAYVAKQRAAIAEQVARRLAAEVATRENISPRHAERSSVTSSDPPSPNRRISSP
ncbi:MAG TPA: DUF4398 domain-containing protein [Usitatibacter sp.]|nr:DUF4398 domain-containing protein [Usitatibacter sp.]